MLTDENTLDDTANALLKKKPLKCFIYIYNLLLMTSTVKTRSLKHKFTFLTAVVNKCLSYCFPSKRKESELQQSGKTRENTVQNRTSLK